MHQAVHRLTIMRRNHQVWNYCCSNTDTELSLIQFSSPLYRVTLFINCRFPNHWFGISYQRVKKDFFVHARKCRADYFRCIVSSLSAFLKIVGIPWTTNSSTPHCFVCLFPSDKQPFPKKTWYWSSINHHSRKKPESVRLYTCPQTTISGKTPVFVVFNYRFLF